MGGLEGRPRSGLVGGARPGPAPAAVTSLLPGCPALAWGPSPPLPRPQPAAQETGRREAECASRARQVWWVLLDMGAQWARRRLEPLLSEATVHGDGWSCSAAYQPSAPCPHARPTAVGSRASRDTDPSVSWASRLPPSLCSSHVPSPSSAVSYMG